MKDTIAPPEDYEQVTLFAWIDIHSGQYPELSLAFHVPNGGHRNPHVGAHMKRMGVRAGVPDILLPVARAGHNGLAIELKRSIGGRVSVEQRTWLNRLTQQGWQAVVCNGADEAIQTIRKYMGVK
jgi:hypothetical protein